MPGFSMAATEKLQHNRDVGSPAVQIRDPKTYRPHILGPSEKLAFSSLGMSHKCATYRAQAHLREMRSLKTYLTPKTGCVYPSPKTLFHVKAMRPHHMAASSRLSSQLGLRLCWIAFLGAKPRPQSRRSLNEGRAKHEEPWLWGGSLDTVPLKSIYMQRG